LRRRSVSLPFLSLLSVGDRIEALRREETNETNSFKLVQRQMPSDPHLLSRDGRIHPQRRAVRGSLLYHSTSSSPLSHCMPRKLATTSNRTPSGLQTFKTSSSLAFIDPRTLQHFVVSLPSFISSLLSPPRSKLYLLIGNREQQRKLLLGPRSPRLLLAILFPNLGLPTFISLYFSRLLIFSTSHLGRAFLFLEPLPHSTRSRKTEDFEPTGSATIRRVRHLLLILHRSLASRVRSQSHPAFPPTPLELLNKPATCRSDAETESFFHRAGSSRIRVRIFDDENETGQALTSTERSRSEAG